jgi:hypothetical protein
MPIGLAAGCHESSSNAWSRSVAPGDTVGGIGTVTAPAPDGLAVRVPATTAPFRSTQGAPLGARGGEEDDAGAGGRAADADGGGRALQGPLPNGSAAAG